MRLSLLAATALAACTPPTAAPRDAGADAVARDATIPVPDAEVFSMKGAYVPVVALQRPTLPAAEPLPVSVPARAAAESKPAIHGAAIANAAVTDDGRAAVTVDRFGAVRLWPTLDGRIEPVAVAAAHPSQLAIARETDLFVIAALDRGGTLEFLSVRPTGASVWRARIDETRPFVRVVATQVGFLALTDDQRIATFSLTGGSRGHLVPEPGEHVVGLVHRGPRALALISTGGAIHGRWITPDGWAGVTPRLRIEPDNAVLTPDGARLAARIEPRGIAIVSTETGRVVESFATDEGDSPGSLPIGFIDGHQLAVVDGMSLGFVQDGKIGPMVFGDDRDRLDVTAVGDGVALAARGASLALATPTGVKILGYKLAFPGEVRMLEHGALITDATNLIRLDDRFAERERYELPPDLWNVVPLDTHRVLALARSVKGTDVVALDLDAPETPATTLVHDAIGNLQYQPATHLYAVVTATHVAVGRYDPRTSKLEGPIEIPLDERSAQIALPAHGVPLVVVDVHQSTEDIAIRDITALDFAKRSFTAAPARTGKLTPEFWSQGLQQLGLVPPERATRGALVAEVANRRIALHDGATLRWVVPAHGIAKLAWSARGELVGVGNGLVHLDLATGAFTGPHCGWGFGLWDESNRETSRFPSGIETVCDVE